MNEVKERKDMLYQARLAVNVEFTLSQAKPMKATGFHPLRLAYS